MQKYSVQTIYGFPRKTKHLFKILVMSGVPDYYEFETKEQLLRSEPFMRVKKRNPDAKFRVRYGTVIAVTDGGFNWFRFGELVDPNSVKFPPFNEKYRPGESPIELLRKKVALNWERIVRDLKKAR